jgi:hypothetical protein
MLCLVLVVCCVLVRQTLTLSPIDLEIVAIDHSSPSYVMWEYQMSSSVIPKGEFYVELEICSLYIENHNRYSVTTTPPSNITKMKTGEGSMYGNSHVLRWVNVFRALTVSVKGTKEWQTQSFYYSVTKTAKGFSDERISGPGCLSHTNPLPSSSSLPKKHSPSSSTDTKHLSTPTSTPTKHKHQPTPIPTPTKTKHSPPTTTPIPTPTSPPKKKHLTPFPTPPPTKPTKPIKHPPIDMTFVSKEITTKGIKWNYFIHKNSKLISQTFFVEIEICFSYLTEKHLYTVTSHPKGEFADNSGPSSLSPGNRRVIRWMNIADVNVSITVKGSPYPKTESFVFISTPTVSDFLPHYLPGPACKDHLSTPLLLPSSIPSPSPSPTPAPTPTPTPTPLSSLTTPLPSPTFPPSPTPSPTPTPTTTPHLIDFISPLTLILLSEETKAEQKAIIWKYRILPQLNNHIKEPFFVELEICNVYFSQFSHYSVITKPQAEIEYTEKGPPGKLAARLFAVLRWRNLIYTDVVVIVEGDPFNDTESFVYSSVAEGGGYSAEMVRGPGCPHHRPFTLPTSSPPPSQGISLFHAMIIVVVFVVCLVVGGLIYRKRNRNRGWEWEEDERSRKFSLLTEEDEEDEEDDD